MPIRYRLQFGWNSASDHEWQYRKTLEYQERCEFDKLDESDKARVVQNWLTQVSP